MFIKLERNPEKKFPQKLFRVIFSIIFFMSQLVYSPPSYAATYTETWTTQGDFESNDTTTGTPTTRNQVDTTTSPGNVILDTWPPENYSEDFTTQDYMDPENTTATWDTQLGELRLPEGVVTDLKAKFIALWGTNDRVLSSLYVNGQVYIGTNIGHFGYYDIATQGVVDLTSKIESFWTGAWIYDMVFYPTNSEIYLVGGSRNFAKYNIPSQVATDLSSRVSSFINSSDSIEAVTCDEARGVIYIGTNRSIFAKYEPSLDQATNLSDKIAYFWAGNEINELKYDSLNFNIYIIGNSGTFAKYDPSTQTAVDLKQQIIELWGTNDKILAHLYFNGKVYVTTNKGRFASYDTNSFALTDLTEKINSFWGNSQISAIVLDSNNNEIYIGGMYGKFAKYNPSTDLATNLRSRIQGFWNSSTEVMSLTFDAIRNDVYLGGWSGKFAKYNTQSEVGTDLTTLIYSFWSTNQIYGLAFDSVNGEIYLGGDAGKFAKYRPQQNDAVDLTNRISSFWSTTQITKLVFHPIRIEIYLSGLSGKFAKYVPTTDLATNLQSRIQSFWGSNTVSGLGFASYDSNIYLGGPSARFAKYNPSTDTATDLRNKIISFWLGGVLAFTFDNVNNDLYLGGDNGSFANYNLIGEQATNRYSYLTSIYFSTYHTEALDFTAATNEIYLGFTSGRFIKYAITTGVITNLTNTISSFWSSNTVNKILYNAVDEEIYLAGASTRFAKFNLASQLATNLNSAISSFWGSNDVNALAFDSLNNLIYLGGNSGNFANYNPQSGIATDLFRNVCILFNGKVHIHSFAYDSTREEVYVGGEYGKFGRYNIAGDFATDLTPEISSFWPSSIIMYGLVFDPSGIIYLGGTQGKFARYDPLQEQATDLTSIISPFWQTNQIFALCFDSFNNKIYLGGANSKFAKYDPSIPPLGEATDLTNRISGFWGTSSIIDLTFDSVSQEIYFGGNHGFAKYFPLNDIATDLSGLLEGLNWNTAVVSICFEPINNEVYIGGNAQSIGGGDEYEARFAKYQTPDGPVVDLKSIINPFFGRQGDYGWVASNVNSLTFSAENGAIFLGGSYSELAKFIISTQTAFDLSDLIEPFWSTRDVNALIYTLEGKTFIGGQNTEFTLLDTPATAQAQSINVNSTGELVGWATLTKEDTPGTGTITYYLSNDGGQNFSEVTPGEQYTFTTSGSDLRWRVILSGEATVQSISIEYGGYYSSGTIQDLKINSGGVAGWATISWNSTLNGQTVKFRTRSAATEPDLAGASWSDYYTVSGSSITSTDNQWLEIEMTLQTTNGALTPSLHDFTVVYAINSPPEVSNVTANEDANGVVQIEYSVRDIDTGGGTAHPGEVDISFQYWDGSNWQETTTTTGETRVSVDEVDWSSYTGTWNAKTDFNGQYLNNAEIRVIADDGEALYNIGSGDSPVFVLDTRNPSSPSIVINSGAQKTNSVNVTLTLSVFDNTMPGMQMMISNDPNFQGASYESYATSRDWVLTDGDGNKIVYVKFKDAYGNESTVASDTIQLDTIAPPVPENVYIDDVSNPETEEWQLFITWGVVSDPDADFHQYNIWRSTDGINYGEAPYIIITDRLTNYLLDQGLNSQITYYYKLTSQDNIGNISVFSEVVSAQPNGTGGGDEVPPVITNVTVDSIGQTTATIIWTTDELSDSTVGYSQDLTYINEQGVPTMVTEHSVTLTGLEPNTLYYFRVKSADASGNEAIDDNNGLGYSFTTGYDSTPPVISNVSASNITQDSSLITWDTDEGATSQVDYGLTTEYGNQTPLDTDLEFSHSVVLSGLQAGTLYYYRVRSKDASNNETIDDNNGLGYSFTTVAQGDTTPPVISGVMVDSIGQTTATIIWTTDELSDSTVGYSQDQTYLTEQGSPTLVISHSVTLTGLEANTLYYLRVKSKDASNNEAIDDNNGLGYSFTTLAQAQDATSPVISSVASSNVTQDSAIISWNTDESATSQVEYGLTTSYGTSSTIDTDLELSHSVILSGLNAETTYHYRVKSKDASSNESVSSDYTFTTLAAEEEEEEESTAEGEEVETEESTDTTTTGSTTGTSTTSGTVALPESFFSTPATGLGEQTQPLPEPLILTTGPSLIEILTDSITMTWITDRPANSIVLYRSFDAPREANFQETGNYTNLVTSHNIKLSGLKPGTSYEFQVKSIDTKGNTIASVLDKFQTLPLPKISDVSVSDITLNSALITWITSIPSISIVEYGLNAVYGSVVKDSRIESSHTIRLNSLQTATTYHFRVKGVDSRGNLMVSEDYTFQTLVKPEILNCEIKQLSFSSALVNWTTNVETDSKVKYTPYRENVLKQKETKIQGQPEFILDHTIELTDLEVGITYEIEVKGEDVYGNEVSKTIPDFAIVPDKVPPTISQVRTEAALTNDKADSIQTLISWKTDEPSTSKVMYQEGSQEKLDKWNETPLSTDLATDHLVVINSFKPGEVYRIKAISADGFANESESNIFTILTPKKKKGIVQVIFDNFEDAFGWVKKIKIHPK